MYKTNVGCVMLTAQVKKESVFRFSLQEEKENFALWMTIVFKELALRISVYLPIPWTLGFGK